MINQLRIANLKGFANRHTVELAPLTLIYGANSAGKSTLLQALLLLKQTLESSDPEQPALVIRGSLADMGSVPGLLNAHDLNKVLEIGLDLDRPPRRRSQVVSTLLGPAQRRFDFAFKWDSEARAVRQTGATLGVAPGREAQYTRRRGPNVIRTGEQLRRRDYPFRVQRKEAKEVFVDWLLDVAETRDRNRPESLRALRKGADRQGTREALIEHTIIAAAPWAILPIYPAFARKDTMPTTATGRSVERLQQYWRQMSSQFHTDISDAFERLYYLGPLRRAPERLHVLSGALRASVGREGEYSAEILSRRPELIDAVNEWLTRLAIPYSIDAVSLSDDSVTTSLGDAVVLVLTDVRSGLQVSPRDVGFGISQLLPIVVQALVSSEGTILVEQPEIHVHPALQAHLADLLVASVEERHNQLVVETHSEHLLLRLLRRVRDGELDPSQIAVLYVDSDAEGNASVVSLRIDDDGYFLDEWPHGFFEERYEELR